LIKLIPLKKLINGEVLLQKIRQLLSVCSENPPTKGLFREPTNYEMLFLKIHAPTAIHLHYSRWVFGSSNLQLVVYWNTLQLVGYWNKHFAVGWLFEQAL